MKCLTSGKSMPHMDIEFDLFDHIDLSDLTGVFFTRTTWSVHKMPRDENVLS